MSFGFDGGEKLAWSIEVRREKTGEYSPVSDAFKSHTHRRSRHCRTRRRPPALERAQGGRAPLPAAQAGPEGRARAPEGDASEANALAAQPSVLQFDHRQLHDGLS